MNYGLSTADILDILHCNSIDGDGDGDIISFLECLPTSFIGDLIISCRIHRREAGDTVTKSFDSEEHADLDSTQGNDEEINRVLVGFDFVVALELESKRHWVQQKTPNVRLGRTTCP